MEKIKISNQHMTWTQNISVWVMNPPKTYVYRRICELVVGVSYSLSRSWNFFHSQGRGKKNHEHSGREDRGRFS